ncbi:xanthine dehydrogenase/oxidase-like [Papilio machaon]|uniref:xanthine dehydrogenase/oxidase-like n=1 Tax=Papilio machaon TaxID=76193 RepID=UPI001E6635D0|nr:xanthine dehydrogenase/oxidase-like [Papilio machaon]
MPKLESLVQCSGEALYCNDVVTESNELFCAFVTADVCGGEIESIDASEALKLPGVLSFYTAKDIPGKNSFLPKKVPGILITEEILCDKKVQYYDQPIGIIVAESEKLANRAARLVKAKYKDIKFQPVLTIADALAREPDRISLLMFYPARGRGLNIKKVIKGKQSIYWQYHYHMETQTCVTKCTEDGIDVYPASQWPNQIHIAISEMLKIEQNRINITIPRCGGSYGAKITRNGLVACACALVTHLRRRACRFVMSIDANMKVMGKRLPYTLEYEMGVDKAGEIQYVEYKLYEDHGYIVSDTVTLFGIAAIKNCYNNTRWQYKLYTVTTDTASNTYARSPGALETIAMTEHLMERISYELDLDPIQVRLKNLNPLLSDVVDIVNTLVDESEYEKRKEEILVFNKNNRWKKRGLRVAMMSWPAGTIMDYHILITVYHGDGTVVVKHGGIEIGQGINTKVAQAVAYTLKISINKIKVKSYDVISNPNSSTTGSSRTTHAICFGAIKCCQIILDRLSTIRDTLKNPIWEILIQAAFTAGINLQASYRVTPNDEEIHRSAGAVVTEVELDILTGEHEILRVDIIEDVGLSLNPEIDVGQIEGAFVMGIGYWTCEQQIYDEKTGELLTTRSWNYHVPLAKDIPIDFRVKLRRNSINPIGTLGARAVGEPPMCLAVSVAFALREAIAASRADTGYSKNEWFDIDGPYTLETNCLKSDVNLDEFLFY